MRQLFAPWNRSLCLAALLAVLAWCLRDGQPAAGARAPAKADGPAKDLTYQEAGFCKDCHTFPKIDYKEKKSLDLILATEYAIWKTHDKHAQAYAVLLGSRGRHIGKLLLGPDADRPDWAERAGCLSCHAMDNLSKENREKNAEKGLDPMDGVSCGGCHGPSSEWGGKHVDPSWRKLTPAKKWEMGMRDLRDPVVRSELCMSCHIGNAGEGKVASHAMFAAGHPPLPPIEIATFSKNEPQHWRDAKDVPAFQSPETLKIRLADYHAEERRFQQTRLALIGNVVALRETMKMVRDRAGSKAEGRQWGWPEFMADAVHGVKPVDAALQAKIKDGWFELSMAHGDCYACHHDLRNPGYRQQRGFGYQLPGVSLIAVRPGRPLVRSWSLGCLPASAAFVGKQDKLKTLENGLTMLAEAANVDVFGNPRTMAAAADAVIAWCEDMVGELRQAPYTPDSSLRLLRALCALYPERKDEPRPGSKSSIPDYETARQIGSILRVVYAEWAVAGKIDEKEREKGAKILAQLRDRLNLEPYSRLRPDRLALLLDVIRTAADPTLTADELPRFEAGAKAFSAHLKNFGDKDELDKMRGNRFLVTLNERVGNKGFTNSLSESKMADRLQHFSDEEAAIGFKAMADYDPDWFLEKLAELARSLPETSR